MEAENLDLRRLLALAGIEAAEHEAADRLQRMLLEEVHHRVKNMLATVMAITSQSLLAADSLEHGRESVEQRLLALGRVQDLLVQINWSSAKLSTIIQSAIAPFEAGESRFRMELEEIEVTATAVLPLALLLNELITNAIKYGALSNEAGHVLIRGHVIAGRLVLVWSEQGGPAVNPPQRRSFGSRLIERGLTRQLDGKAVLDFLPAGVVCTFDLPLRSVIAAGG